MVTVDLVSPNKTSELAVSSSRLASKPPSEITLRQWFVKFATLKREEFHKTFINLWCEALRDIEPHWIEFGCQLYFRSMKFFPMPGDIREINDQEKRSRRLLQVCCRTVPGREVDEIEAAIEESCRRFIPAEQILRDRREARDR
jgi:hypothetical protein